MRFWSIHGGQATGSSLRLEGDRGAGAAVPDQVAEGVGGETAVTDHPARDVGQAAEQNGSQRQLVRLAGGEGEGDGASSAVGDHTGLGAKAAARREHAIPW